MSVLARRIDQLERSLPPCSHCFGRKVLELCGPGPARRAQAEERCSACDELVERVTVLVAFDPGPSGRA